jgi:hypothetical protein
MRVCSLFLIILITFLFSCKNQEVETEIETEESTKVVVNEKNLTFEERAERHITGSLSIPATEKFSIQYYKAHLNADNDEDAIVVVNRLEFAKSEVNKLPNAAYISKLGYMGNYNYFVFYDGAKDKFSVPIATPSSALTPLKVKFENIYSDIYSNLTIEYRMRNSAFKNFYFLENGILQKVFQTKIYDYIGTDKPEAFFIEYTKGSISSAKDMLVYEGKIKDYTADVKDIYDYNPIIEKKENAKLVLKWFYNPRIAAYMTPETKPRD